MKTNLKKALHLLIVLFATSCVSSQDLPKKGKDKSITSPSFLALGDSYTIGQSVCDSCSFPKQLQAILEVQLKKSVEVKIIAKTGWTTTNLMDAITYGNISTHYGLVTLLIGVNNQYQNKDFSIYQKEFPALLDEAIKAAGGDSKKVVVISIPDYAFTPAGQSSNSPTTISEEIDTYNAFAKKIAEEHSVKFLEITDITRRGIQEPELVAKDKLHPSKAAYKEFSARLLPLALAILKQ